MRHAIALYSESTGAAQAVLPAAVLRAELIAGVALRLADRGLRLIRP